MPVTTSIDRLNYEELLPLFRKSKAVTIVTYSLETKRDNPLWAALSAVPAGSKLTIIACIPPCAMNFQRMTEGDSAWQIRNYYAALNPAKFKCQAETWLSHRNHAKILRCDDRAYVGSANFSMGSQQNFEAGYLTDNAADLGRLDQLVADIKARAIPYFKVGPSLFVQQLLQFAADAPWLREQIEYHAYDARQVYKDSWVLELSMERYGVPPRVAEIIHSALETCAALDKKAVAGDALSAGEQSLYDAGVTVTLQHIADDMESVRSQGQLPTQLHPEATSHSLLEKYAMEEDPASAPAFLEEVESTLETNRKERLVAANAQMAQFLKGIERAAADIFAALRA